MELANYYFSGNCEINKNNLLLRGIKNNDFDSSFDKFKEVKNLNIKLNKLREEKNKRVIKRISLNDENIVKKEMNNIENQVNYLNSEISNLVNFFPNIPISDEDLEKFNYSRENVIINEFHFKNRKINNCLKWEEILDILKITDENRSIKLSGSKFFAYKGFGSDLLHILINFMYKENKKRGYVFFDLPYLVKGEMLYNTGQFPKFKNDVYEIKNHNLYLIPTSEVTLINFYSNEIINESLLPIKISSYSPCFRLEAGKSGKEYKSPIRLHQFHKIELVKIVNPNNSYKELLDMLDDSCNILKKLKIDYRIVDLSFEELGISSVKTYDIEIWLPNSKKWIEISSCSNCTSFQSIRGKIRIEYKDNKKRKFHPHILNGSALAIDRLIIAICEYYYNQEKKMIELPKCLKKYL